VHLALVIDGTRLRQDGAAVERLAVALVSDGIRVRRVLPPSADEPRFGRLIPHSTFDFGSAALFRPARLGALSSELEDDRPDAFVSFGPEAFSAAAELAHDLDAGLVAMASTLAELDATPLRRHLDRLDLVAVPTAPLALRAGRVAGERVATVLPLGIASAPPRHDAAAATNGIAIAGSGRDDGAYRAVFRALAEVAPGVPELQVAIELPDGHDPNLWALARELGIQRFLNGVSSLESIRPIALSCGTMLLPEPVGGTRSIVLEAMALGRTVVAMDDAQADHLVDGVTALVAQERDHREWAALLSRALGDRALALRVGAEASARTVARFGSSACATHLANECERALRGPSIPFPGASAG
jgi:hypothetical protein